MTITVIQLLTFCTARVLYYPVLLCDSEFENHNVNVCDVPQHYFTPSGHHTEGRHCPDSLTGVWLGVGAGATGDEHTSDQNHKWVPSHLHSVRRSTRLADFDIPWLPQWEGQGGVEAVARLCHLQAQKSIRFWSKYVGHHETVDVLRHKEVCPLNLHCFLQPRHYHSH